MPHKFKIDSYWNDDLQFGDMLLRQIGVRHCEAGEIQPEHLHGRYYELSIVLNGEGVITTNNEDVAVKKNDVHLSYPYETHKLQSSEKAPLQYMFCAFYPLDSDLSKELLKISETFKPAQTRLVKSDTLAARVENLFNQQNVPDEPFYSHLMHAILTEIAVFTVRAFKKSKRLFPKYTKAQELCYQLMAYLNENAHSLASLESIGEIFNYNYSHISRVFKKTTDQTLSSYYQNVRLRYAERLIAQNYSFTEVAEQLHFASLYSFSKSFKKHFGISPSAYKKTLREK